MPKTRSPYDVHPSIAYIHSIVENLPKKTGRSLEQWIALVKKKGPKSEKERRAWLSGEHELGGTTASLIAEFAEGKGAEDFDPETYLENAVGYVEQMYAGPKASLRPIHDALIELGRSLGRDVKVCPCKTIVPFYRNHVFAQIKPSTKTRIDFELALKGSERKLPKRLLDTGGLEKGDRITHCFPIESLEEIDREMKNWLTISY